MAQELCEQAQWKDVLARNRLAREEEYAKRRRQGQGPVSRGWRCVGGLGGGLGLGALENERQPLARDLFSVW